MGAGTLGQDETTSLEERDYTCYTYSLQPMCAEQRAGLIGAVQGNSNGEWMGAESSDSLVIQHTLCTDLRRIPLVTTHARSLSTYCTSLLVPTTIPTY